jgi:hypothetical protein
VNPVTFLLAASILVALDAGWVSWVLFGIAAVVGLVARAALTAAQLTAKDNAELNKLS